MSTTTREPSTPVVLRMMPSGSVNRCEVARGVLQPFTQVADCAPFLGNGRWGSGGGVGDAGTDGGSDGECGEIADSEAVRGWAVSRGDPPQARSENAEAAASRAVIRVLIGVGEWKSIPRA